MREALAGLTVRGRAFLAAGVTTIVCSIIVGHPALVRVGVLVTALPLLTALWIGRSRYRLALVRTVSPQLVAAGQPCHVHLTMTNEARTPTGRAAAGGPPPLRARHPAPFRARGHRPRLAPARRATRCARTSARTLRRRSDDRPRHRPLRPHRARPDVPRHRPLTVTPRTVPLPGIMLGGAWTGSGDNRPRSFATGSAEDVTVREYRRGDDLRRVHWRSSARVGELMVRREEQPWQSRATVFLDNRRPRTAGRASPVAGGRGLRRRVRRGAPRPPRLRRTARHRLRREPRHGVALPQCRGQHRSRCSRRWRSCSSTTPPRPDTRGWPSPARVGSWSPCSVR